MDFPKKLIDHVANPKEVKNPSGGVVRRPA